VIPAKLQPNRERHSCAGRNLNITRTQTELLFIVILSHAEISFGFRHSITTYLHSCAGRNLNLKL